jgi:hypothetical protein
LATSQLSERLGFPLDERNLRDLSDAEASKLGDWLSDRATWPKQIVISSPTLWLKDRLTTNSNANRGWWSTSSHIENLLQTENQRDQLSKAFSMVGITLAALAWMCIGTGLVCWVLILATSRHAPLQSARCELWRAAAVFAVALACTFSLLGLVPAYRPELQQYSWAVGGAIIGLIVVAVGFGFWRLARFVWRQSQLPRRDRSALRQPARLILVIAGALVFLVALFSLIDFRFREVAKHFIERFPANLVSKRGADYATVEALGIVHWENFGLAVLEWAVRGGLFWTIGLTFGCLIFIRWRQLPAGEGLQPRFINLLRHVIRPAIWLAILLILISVAFITQSIYDLQSRYQRELARLADPAWLAKEADAQTKKLELSLPLQANP